MQLKKFVFGLASLTFLTCELAQAEYPVQLSLWPPNLQLVPESESIRGIRLGIYGRNVDMTGLDCGAINETTGDFCGVGGGIINLVDGNARGLQLSFFGYQRTGGSMYGWASGLFTRVKEDTVGLQEGFVSMTERDFKGVQASMAYNFVGEEMVGAQFGLINRASGVRGVQLGLVNFAERMNGLQLGLWNQINQNDLKVLPFVNWRF
jgi:hypothetical protein